MADTAAAPATDSLDWNKTLNNLLNGGTNIFSAYLGSQATKGNNKTDKAVAQAQAQSAQQTSGLLKYLLIGGGVLVAVVVAVMLLKKK